MHRPPLCTTSLSPLWPTSKIDKTIHPRQYSLGPPRGGSQAVQPSHFCPCAYIQECSRLVHRLCPVAYSSRALVHLEWCSDLERPLRSNHSGHREDLRSIPAARD